MWAWQLKKKLNDDVGRNDHEWNTAIELLQQKKIGESFAYCLIFVSQAGNAVIEIIVYMRYQMTR